jgi:hypothetical protein
MINLYVYLSIFLNILYHCVVIVMIHVKCCLVGLPWKQVRMYKIALDYIRPFEYVDVVEK